MSSSKLNSDLKIKACSKRGLHLIEPRFNLKVRKNADGALVKSFLYRFTHDKKEHTITLGVYPGMSLSAARIEKDTIHGRITQWKNEGFDPMAKEFEFKSINQRAEDLRLKKVKTFKQCTTIYRWMNRGKYKRVKERKEWRASLVNHAFDHIGHVPVGEMTTDHIILTLTPLWAKYPSTASDVRGRIESVLALASVMGFRDIDAPNPARWKKHLEYVFPAVNEVAPPKHHKALPHDDIPAFYSRVRDVNLMQAKAVALMVLTGARPGDVLDAKWDEIDLDEKVWIIGLSKYRSKGVIIKQKAGQQRTRHKTGGLFCIPLTDEMLDVINEAKALKLDDVFVFPGQNSGTHISDTIARKLVKTLSGDKDMTMHGFRSSNRDWYADETDVPDSVAEAILSHQIKDKAVAAYFRSELIGKRRKALALWGQHCIGLGNNNVVEFKLK